MLIKKVNLKDNTDNLSLYHKRKIIKLLFDRFLYSLQRFQKVSHRFHFQPFLKNMRTVLPNTFSPTSVSFCLIRRFIC